MVRFTSFLFALCCVAFLFASCSKEGQQVQPDEADFELRVKNLNVNMDIPLYQRLDFGLAEREKFNMFLEDAAEGFFAPSDIPLDWMTIDGHYDYTIFDAGKSLDGDSGGDAKGCGSAGWTTVGEGLCRSAECVRGRLEDAYDAAGEPKPGQCVVTRVERGLLGAAVCYRIGDC